MVRSIALVLAAATLLTLTSARAVRAQNTEDQNAFDFSLPGARSRAIGGAFVAIADDATAVYSNPAGLTLLFRPEVSIELRRWNLTDRMPSRGHAFGPPSGIGIDTIGGLVNDDFDSHTTGVSFLSFVYPGRNWAVGAFRHQLSRYRMERRIEGPFFDCRGGFRLGNVLAEAPFCEPHAEIDGVDREFPKLQSLDLDIHSTGAAFALDLPAGVSLGLAVQYFSFAIDSTNTVFSARGDQKYLPANFADPQNVELVSRQTGNDNAFAFNAGVLWEVSQHWVAGASFKQGPRFEFSTDTVRGAASGAPGEHVDPRDDNVFRVPDTFSLGLVFRPTTLWRVSVEYDRVQFHELIEKFGNTAFYSGSPELAVVASGMKLDDSNQIRVGAEYLAVLPGSRSLALRGGLWHDPNHRAYFDADPATGRPAPRWTLLFPRRSGSTHVTGGIGFTTRRHFQVDVAVDYSDMASTFSLSSVWRF